MREWWNNLSEMLSSVATIVGVVVAMASGWAVVWTWVGTWDWVQRGTAIFIAICLAFILTLAIYTWWRRTQIHKIPILLYKLDGMLRNYVNHFNPEECVGDDVNKLCIDLGELMHIAIYPLGNAFLKQDKSKLLAQTERYRKTIGDPAESIKNGQSLITLMQISALMNEHHIGLTLVKSTPQYQQVLKMVGELERIQPDPQVSIKIDNYLRWADGLYSQLIGMKFITSKPTHFAILPAEWRAVVSYSQPVVEDYADVLIAQVSKSLNNSKDKEKEDDKGRA